MAATCHVQPDHSDHSDWPSTPPTLVDWPAAADHTGAGRMGLVNLGNTCYQNAILQSLLQNEQFVARLRATANHSSHHVTQTSAADDVCAQFLALHNLYADASSTCGAIRAEGVRDAIARRHPAFGDGRQHDAQEFLALLLDAIHERLNDSHFTALLAKRVKLGDDAHDDDDDDDGSQLAAREWARYRQSSGRSCVVDVFAGQLRSVLECDHCRHVSTSFEPFMYLALPIPVRKEKRLQVVLTALDGRAVRVALSVENKYASLVTLKESLRHAVPWLSGVANEDLVVAEVQDGFRVVRVVDDGDDIVSLSVADNQEVVVFQLNEVQARALPALEPHKQCIICLEDKALSQLLSHSRTCVDGHFCESCLEQSVRHYSNNCQNTPFLCPALLCGQNVTRQDFAQSQIMADRHFAIPLLFRAENRLLYRVLMVRVRSQLDSSHIYALVDARVPSPEHTYKLLFVEKDGMNCCRCSWGAQCEGCEVSRDGVVTLSENDALCVLFETTPAVSAEVVDDSSVQRMREEAVPEEKRLNVAECLQEFIANECLASEDNHWFCARCQRLRSAHKSLQITVLPRTLILYLKRFLFVANRSYKLDEEVDFPVDQKLDISRLAVNPLNEPLLYSLDALVCHHGTVHSGHYTCYARHEHEWFYFNDHVVTQERPSGSDARAYILFYTRQDQCSGGEGKGGTEGAGGSEKEGSVRIGSSI